MRGVFLTKLKPDEQRRATAEIRRRRPRFGGATGLDRRRDVRGRHGCEKEGSPPAVDDAEARGSDGADGEVQLLTEGK